MSHEKSPKRLELKFLICLENVRLMIRSSANQMQIESEKNNANQIEKSKSPPQDEP